MAVFDQGSLNTANFAFPGVAIQIIPPSPALIGGVNTSIIGYVGTATFGPVNAPVSVSGGSMKDFMSKFGGLRTDKYNLYTAVAVSVLMGAKSFRCVRVTDGTDTAATIDIQSSLTITSRYTGTTGNTIGIAISAGNQKNTFKVTVQLPGFSAEVYNNIGGTGATFWTNVANAINQGIYGQSGISQLVVANATGSATPTANTYTLAGGTDGNSGVTDTMIVGADGVTRSGMYALRGSGHRNFVLCDVTDSSKYGAEVDFATSEGSCAILSGGIGEQLADAIATKSSIGLDTWRARYVLGDYVQFNNGVSSVWVSPQYVLAAVRAIQAPQYSILNLQLQSISVTQSSAANLTYSGDDLGLAQSNGIEILGKPSPGGDYFSFVIGRNCASNPTVSQDTYTTMTNFLAYSLDNFGGKFVGKIQDPTERLQAKAAFDIWLGGLAKPVGGTPAVIGAPDGSKPFNVVLDSSNNSNEAAAEGTQVANITVVYQSIIYNFLINLQGGASVEISSQTFTPQ